MAIYNQEQGLQSILNAALGEYHSMGFRLVDFNNSPALYYQDEIVGILTQGESTIPNIHGACREYLLEVLGAS